MPSLIFAEIGTRSLIFVEKRHLGTTAFLLKSASAPLAPLLKILVHVSALAPDTILRTQHICMYRGTSTLKLFL